MRIRSFFTGLLAAAAVMASAASAQASTWIFSGTNDDGKAVSAAATITLTGNMLNIALTNTGDDMVASNQAISGLFLEFDNDPTGVSGLTQAGDLYKLNGVTNTATYVGGSVTHWGASIISGGALRLWTLTGGPPKHLIAQAVGQDFSGMNTGVKTHNPYILGTGTFSAAFTGPSTRVVSAKFLFGTSPSSTQFAGTCVGCGSGSGIIGVPEPATWAMMIIGFGGVGAVIRRRRVLAI